MPVSRSDNTMFSIVVTCYNDGLYIEEAIQSINSSTYKNIEIIVVDDCSPDELTKAKLNSIEQSGLRVIRKIINKGVSDSRNIGIAEAKSNHILLLDADDIIHATYLEKALEYLNRGFDVVYCNVRNFGEVNSIRIAPDFSLPLLLSGNFIASCSAFKKQSWIKTGGFDITMQCYEDWEFWVNAAGNGSNFVHINEVLFDYRRKVNSVNSKCGDPGIRAKMVAYVINKHIHLYQKHFAEIIPNLHMIISTLENDLLNIEKMSGSGNLIEYYNIAKQAKAELDQRTAYYENSFFWKLKRISDKILGR